MSLVFGTLSPTTLRLVKFLRRTPPGGHHPPGFLLGLLGLGVRRGLDDPPDDLRVHLRFGALEVGEPPGEIRGPVRGRGHPGLDQALSDVFR